MLTCLSLQCTAQVKLCVRLPDITLTNCWKVMAEVVLEYLRIRMVMVIIAEKLDSSNNFSHYLHL